ncbi:PAS domain-containing protein [Maritimibacter dapengensis]|uniref:PAS domain-containing protein n=1 Tax=Maritimibacter dapengensis TaxID=2836868 RepID=A0ABS6T284_9RHOB|nr:PAS domain-containing protein [Maritimibacter dapengensis]MBV7379358.1 PAS domain-containing protein [Maritimibacter dapengensis]
MKIEYMKGTNVISITPIRDQLNFPSIRRVEAYWEGLRNGRLMPARREVDPRGISDVLEFAFVLEKIAPGVARFRLAGMHLNDLMGMEVRGMPITAMFLPEARRDLKTLLETVLESPAKVKVTLDSDHGLTRPKLEAQMVLLPLKDEQGRPTRVFGALQAKGKIGRGPRRFRIQSKEIDPILGDEPPLYAGFADASAPKHKAELAERQAAFQGKSDDDGGFLRLVHDADKDARRD